MKRYKWIFLEKRCYLWGGKEFAFDITPMLSFAYYKRHIHIGFDWLFWGITISIRTYKYK